LVSQARRLQEEQQRERDLEAHQRTVFTYMEAKNRVAREVASWRLSLVEGAARFRALCQASPSFSLKMHRFIYPSDSDEECYCRALIHQVRWVLADDPAQAQEAAGRLEAELTELLHQGPPSFPLRGKPVRAPST
jgi:hypothetical protein